MNQARKHLETVFLTEQDVAERWALATKTLANQRSLKIGPPWHRIGGSVRYKLEDVVAYEERHKGCAS